MFYVSNQNWKLTKLLKYKETFDMKNCLKICVVEFKTNETGVDFHSEVFGVCSEVMKLVQVCIVLLILSSDLQ